MLLKHCVRCCLRQSATRLGTGSALRIINCCSVVQASGQGRAAGGAAGGTTDFGSRIQSTLQNAGSTLQQSASRMSSRELSYLPSCCADNTFTSALHTLRTLL